MTRGRWAAPLVAALVAVAINVGALFDRLALDDTAIFAHPARYEPFGLAVLEAANAGCALVLGDIPSLREQWDRAAVFVAPGDERAHATALQELIADEELLHSMAIRARLRARCNDARTMAARYLALYTRLRAQVAA